MIAATGAFTAIFYWYFRPFPALGQVSEMLPLSFARLGVAFAAWTLLAYALASFLGAVFRRTVLAMVITLVLYVVLATATATAIRPHYAAPITVPSRGIGNTGASNGWVISDLEKAPNGQVLSRDDLYHYFRAGSSAADLFGIAAWPFPGRCVATCAARTLSLRPGCPRPCREGHPGHSRPPSRSPCSAGTSWC